MFSPSERHGVGGVPFAYVRLRATARTLDAVIKTLKLAECKVSRINHERGGGRDRRGRERGEGGGRGGKEEKELEEETVKVEMKVDGGEGLFVGQKNKTLSMR